MSHEWKMFKSIIYQLRHRTLKLVRNACHSVSGRISLRLMFGPMVMGIGFFLIAGGAIVAGISFKESRFPSFSIMILENDLVEEPLFSWVVRGESRFQRSGSTITKLVIEPDWRDGFSSGFPKSIPEGLFLPLMESTAIQSVSAKLWFVNTGEQVVEKTWIQQVDLERKKIQIPTTVEDISCLNNYPGVNSIVLLDYSGIPESRQYKQRVDFSLEIELKDAGFKNILYRYAKGLLSVHFSLSASEQQFLGITKNKLGNRELPGRLINFKENPKRIERVEYTWQPELSGEFLTPEDMIGAERFWENGKNSVESSFVFKTNGFLWYSYIAAIIGFPILIGGFSFIRKRQHFGIVP